MSIYKKRVWNVSRDNWKVINIQIVDIIDNFNSSSTWWISRLYNPNITLRVRLSEFLIMRVEFMKLIRQYVRIRDKIKCRGSKFFLHFYIIEAKTIFTGYLIALWEMIDSLELIQTFIKVWFATTTCPENIPLVRLGIGKCICF